MDIQTATHSLMNTAMQYKGMTAAEAAEYVWTVLFTERPELAVKLALSLGINPA